MFENKISLIQTEETNDDKFFIFNYNCWKNEKYDFDKMFSFKKTLTETRKNLQN